MSKLKLWLLRKWLRLLPDEELVRELEWRRNTQIFNQAYEELAKSMIDTYFQEYMTTKQRSR